MKSEAYNMLTTNEIGERIAVARKLKNRSQAQLAEQLAVSAQAVGKWERGESMPDILMFQRMAAVLGTDINYFAGEGGATPEAEPADVSEAEAPERPGWNMSRSNWADADFSGLSGLAERFSGANIERCRFVGSEMAGLKLLGNNIRDSDFSRSVLSGCRFGGANLKDSNFSNSILSGCRLSSTNLERSTFAGCDFSQSELKRSEVTGCDFSAANLTGVASKFCNFKKVSLTGAILYRTRFSFGQFTELTFTGELNECTFENCDFARVAFEGAVLRQCFFKNTKLKRVKFIGCRADRLTYAFLKAGKADLSDVEIIEEEA